MQALQVRTCCMQTPPFACKHLLAEHCHRPLLLSAVPHECTVPRDSTRYSVLLVLCSTMHHPSWPVCPGMSRSHVATWKSDARRAAVTTVALHVWLLHCFRCRKVARLSQKMLAIAFRDARNASYKHILSSLCPLAEPWLPLRPSVGTLAFP